MKSHIISGSAILAGALLIAGCGGGGGGGSTPTVATTIAPVATTTTAPPVTTSSVTILRSNLSQPGNIIEASAGGQIYWLDFSAQTFTAENVPTGTYYTYPNNGSVFDLTQDATNVYYSENQGQNVVAALAKPVTGQNSLYIVNGSGATPQYWPPCAAITFQALCGVVPSGIATGLTAGVVYFACGNGTAAAPSGGGTFTVGYNASGNACVNNAMFSMAADAGGLYLVAFGGAASTIQYVSYSGTPIGSSGGYGPIYALQAGASSGAGSGAIFFIDAGSGKLYQLHIVGNTGGSSSLLATGAGSPVAGRALTVDANYVYFISAGAIEKVAIAGSGGATTPVIEVTAANAGNPVSLAVDNSTIYWTAAGNGIGNGSVRYAPKI